MQSDNLNFYGGNNLALFCMKTKQNKKTKTKTKTKNKTKQNKMQKCKGSLIEELFCNLIFD